MHKTVIIVDDHPIYRAGLKALLKSSHNLQLVGEAAGYREAKALFLLSQPDIAIVDLSLMEGSGLQLIKSMRAESKKVRILVASMHDDLLFAERALREGANGYINKAQAADNILEAIQVILRGEIYLSTQVSSQILQRKLKGSPITSHNPIELLSARELEVFTRIGQGMSSKNIARQLNVSTKTIDSHREHIKHKLGIEDGNVLIQRAVTFVLTTNEMSDS